MAERLEIIDPCKQELEAKVKSIDWSKFLLHGWVKIKISDGKPILVAREILDRIV